MPARAGGRACAHEPVVGAKHGAHGRRTHAESLGDRPAGQPARRILQDARDVGGELLRAVGHATGDSVDLCTASTAVIWPTYQVVRVVAVEHVSPNVSWAILVELDTLDMDTRQVTR